MSDLPEKIFVAKTTVSGSGLSVCIANTVRRDPSWMPYVPESFVARERDRALVKAALERSAIETERIACNDFVQKHGWSGIPAIIRALADDPEAVAEIVEQVKGENDG